MTARLVERGMPRFDIFAEAFASPPIVPRTLEPQTVHIAGSDQSFVWSPELGTLLDAAQAAGLSLPSGCRVGQCESCVMRIVEGNVAQLGGDDGATGPVPDLPGRSALGTHARTLIETMKRKQHQRDNGGYR